MNGTALHLHARIFRTGTGWYADVDDELDPQPDNPQWCGLYHSHRAAIDAACAHIAARNLHRIQQLGTPTLTA
ncbi:hypothetical protein FB561_3440 [Kribbella amoyensis]|uniref:Uncharacterized protein n=1 Tax=Kribbella amoyensis TaxID=996641 RepID=A0A561BTQ1_9ACTN|nr:hypothetical protein [Kribbella amoyensis]TWD82310.1 hypothetical protein FB561_3440 [Kribbella amoyensis]